jgi:uncharacterized alkaline shock family protein YloU
VAENKEYISREEELGNINISEEVLSSIAAAAVLDVEGVAGLSAGAGSDAVTRKSLTKSIRLSMENDEICIGVAIMVKYGHVVTDVAKEVQEAVKSAVENTSGLSVVCVNVTVAGVTFSK